MGGIKMSMYKQIQEKFWQSDFVLELKPEERYFYMYLITNTMTTHCGVYKFNLKLAELETGLTPEVIEKHLSTFESRGKIVISKTSKEIMIVNWFKHNFKSNKKTIASINKELKEVKDKEFLKQLHEICERRQYPINEIFNGIIIASAENQEGKNMGQALPETTELQAKAVEEVSQDEIKELKETGRMLFTELKETAAVPRGKKRKGKAKEEAEVIECNDSILEDDTEETFEGTTIASWSFADSGGAGDYAEDDTEETWEGTPVALWRFTEDSAPASTF
jgi:hypothetical protein